MCVATSATRFCKLIRETHSLRVCNIVRTVGSLIAIGVICHLSSMWPLAFERRPLDLFASAFHGSIQYNTIPCNAIRYNTIQYNTIQYNTIQHNTIQYNTIQHNTTQDNTILILGLGCQGPRTSLQTAAKGCRGCLTGRRNAQSSY